MSPKATNFNKNAVVNDGSCVFPIPKVPTYGCMDKLALNYNKKATVENGSCKFKQVISKTKGCFNGPMAGVQRKGVTTKTTIKAKPWCRIVNIQSCNQAKLSNGPIWCYMKMQFDPRDNCPDLIAESGYCKGGKNLGLCHKETVTGDLNDIWMYESNYKG